MEQRTYRIFTDGACTGNPGPGGWGAIVSTPDGKVWELGGSENPTTNNRMELQAAFEALRSIVNLPPAPVEIYTDSKYVIQGITAWIFGWEKRGWVNQEGNPVSHSDLWKELRVLTKQFRAKIDWLYIAGHSAFPGNERCDRIAVAFAKNTKINLFHGERKNYAVDLDSIPPVEDPNAPKPKGDPYYLSYVDGELFRDKTWSACESRVKGKKAVKFKKVRDSAEEARVLKEWGISFS